MTYFVNKTNGTAIIVADGTKDTTSTSLTLLGRLSSNYGEDQNENFVKLLENFAFSSSPSNPITGQLWYDTTNAVIKIYDSTTSTWSSVGQKIQGNIISTANLTIGSQGFEIQEITGDVKLINKTTNGNISIYSNVSGTSTLVLGINGTTGLLTVVGNPTNNLGVTTKSYVDNSISVVQANLANSISLVQANIDLINAGTGSLSATDLSLNGNVALSNSGTGNTVVNLLTPGGVAVLSAQGSNDAATPVTIKGQWVLGTNANLQANYADLAENFASDREYDPGTVLTLGGTKEVTISTVDQDTKVAGVVTTDPAFVMNHKLIGTKSCIALQGRVPCKVVGPIELGDLLVTSDIPGHARKAISPTVGSVLGKALQNYNSTEPGIIEILVGRM
jgi:hypothetical protein